MDPSVLSFQFTIGAFVFERNLADVTHQESLRAPQPGGNTMNWIVGHVVRTRNQALGLLGHKSLFDDGEFLPYGAGTSKPEKSLPIDELKRRFAGPGPAIADALNQTTKEQFQHAAPFSPTGKSNETVGTLLVSIAFHEAYHLG